MEKKTKLNNKQKIELRHSANQEIRAYFEARSFLEIETPYLIEGNAPDLNIDPLSVKTCEGKILELHTSPEIWMKKGLANGIERGYQLVKAFRDDPRSPIHQKEFSMLEWYRSGADLFDLLLDCENLMRIFSKIVCTVIPDAEVSDQNPEIKIQSISDLALAQAGINLDDILQASLEGDGAALPKEMQKNGELLPANATFDEAFSVLMAKYIEPGLPKDQVVALVGWPYQLSALSQIDPKDPRFCQRFEIYYRGLEIANAYQECNDPEIICKRFQEQGRDRLAKNTIDFSVYDDFFASIAKLGKTSGIALGVDRALLASINGTKLEEVIFQ